MAIVRMEKLRLLCARAQKDELIRELMLLGCVELHEQNDVLGDVRTAGLVSKELGNLSELRSEKAVFNDAIKLLNKYAPYKSPLLSAKPVISEKEFLDDTDMQTARQVADEIISLDESIRNAYLEQVRCTTLIEVLTPWKDFDSPLESTGTEHVELKLGCMPMAGDIVGLCAALTERLGEAELTQIATDEHTRYMCILFMRSLEAEANDVFREFGVVAPAFGNATGLAKDGIAAAQETLKKLEMERSVCEAQIAADAKHRELLKVCSDRLSTKEGRAEATELLLRTDKVICLEGWTTEPENGKLTALLERFDCAYEFESPSEEEYPEVPVKLKNNRVTNALNMVTNMYSLPQYGTVDPNPLMAPFFILFYGIMMADMGYGLIMIVAALVAMKKMRPKEGTLSFCQLLLYSGIATFIMGALTGGFFADAPYQVVHMLNPDSTWQGLPYLFSPLNDSIYVLGGAMVLGFIQLNTGLAISFVQKLKHGDIAGAVFYEVALWVIAVGLILAVLGVGSVGGVSVALVIGGVMLLYGSGRNAKGFGKVTAVFGVIYNELTGWFGDILSYSRIMALMLAGSVIGQVFNTIASLFGNIVLFIIIFLIGHALNFGLNLLGCYVHDLRLQCLEYFGKFYTDGGRPFKPLKVNTKYVEVNK